MQRSSSSSALFKLVSKQYSALNASAYRITLSQFATIDDVRRAQLEADGVIDSLIEERNSDLASDEESCIVVSIEG